MPEFSSLLDILSWSMSREYALFWESVFLFSGILELQVSGKQPGDCFRG